MGFFDDTDTAVAEKPEAPKTSGSFFEDSDTTSAPRSFFEDVDTSRFAPEEKPPERVDTLEDDWAGFTANMFIAGNRLAQGVAGGAVDSLMKLKEQADRASKKSQAFGTPDADPDDYTPSQWMVSKGASMPEGSLPRRKFEEEKERLNESAGTLFQQFQRGAMNLPEFADYISSKEKRIQELQPILSPEMQQLNRSEGVEFWKTFAANPIESLANVIGSSAVVGAPAIAGAALGSGSGVLGTAIGAGMGSYSTETSQSLIDAMKEQRVDFTKPEDVLKAFENPAIMKDARDKAESRGVAVAAFDAATARLAGIFIGPVLKSPTTRTVLSATAKELGMQMGGGASGELAAQVISGEEISGKDIALEALGEIGSGVTETIGNVRAANRILAETAAATPPAPITPPTAPETPSDTTQTETPSEPVAPAPALAETTSELPPSNATAIPEPAEPTPEVEVPQQQTSPTVQEPPKVLTEDERADILKPHLKAAEAAAKAAGAPYPEDAAQLAWFKVSKNKKPLDNPRAVLIDAARSEAGNQRSKAGSQKAGGGLVEGMDVAELEESAVETRGPRAETVAKEDIEQITKAIETLNENETRVAKVLMRGEDLSNAEIAEELGLAVGTVKNIKMKIEEVFRPYAERMGFGQSLGPGAASAAEVLTQYEVRRFSERFQKSKDIDEDVREQTGNRYYEVLPNQVTAEKAREFFEQNPDTERAISIVMDEGQSVSFADRAAIGQLLVKKINEERKALKTSDPERADRLLDRVIEASEWLAEYGTRLGQGVQAFAMWNRLTPEGKLRSVQKEVQKTRKKFIRDNQKDVDEVHDILSEDTSMEVKRSKLSKSRSRTAKAAKKNLNKIPKKPTKEQLLDTLSKDLGLPTLTPEQQAEIMRLAEIAENAAEGMPKEDALNELNSYIAHIKGFHWSDLPLGIYYGNILSGIPTQAVNLVDTALNVVSEVAGSAIVGSGSQRSISDAFGMLSGLARGLDSGRWDALLAITKGRRISDGKFVENPYLMDIARFGEEGGVPIQQTGKIAETLKKAAESKYAKYLKGYKYVGRVMAASDSLMFRSAQEARAAQLAHWLAYDSGLKGKALRDEVDHILGFDRKEEFLEQAEAEGYTGATAKARATELMLQSRPEGLQKEATQFASEATYNYKPEGMMGAISNAIEGFSRSHPAVKLIVPFTRIVANVTNRGLNYTPWGAFRAWRMDSDGKTLTDQERRKQQMLYTRAVMGVSAMSVIGAMAAMGFIKLHGKGPDDDEKRKQLRETGWKPYTIQIGNQYFTYTYTPIGLGLAALANSLEAKRYGTLEDKDIYTAFAYAIQSIGSTIFSQSFLSNLSSFFEALSNRGSQGVSAFKRLISSTASGLAVPFSSAVKDVNQLFDPKVRKPENINEALISEIPVARLAVKPAINALGDPIEKDRIRLRERFMSSNKEGVWKMIRETGLRIPTTGPFFMNPEEDYEYAKKTGERIKGYLVRNEEMLRSLPQKVAQDSLVNFADRVKKEVRGEMLYKRAKKKPKK